MVLVQGAANQRAGAVRAMLFPVVATVVVFSPQLVTNSRQLDNLPPIVSVGWLAVLLLAAPVVALQLNRRRPFADNLSRALQSGLPQLPLAVGLVLLHVWLDVRSGYLLAGSGEEAMSYGIGVPISVGLGLLLMTLVAAAARLGAETSRGLRAR